MATAASWKAHTQLHLELKSRGSLCRIAALGTARRHYSAQMEFNKLDLVFQTKLDDFSCCWHAASVAKLQLKSSSWPKIHSESAWLSTILAVQHQLVCSEAVLSSCPDSSLWHCVDVLGVWDIIFNVLPLSYLVKSYCFVYKQYVHTHKDVQTHTCTHIYLSSSLFGEAASQTNSMGCCYE